VPDCVDRGKADRRRRRARNVRTVDVATLYPPDAGAVGTTDPSGPMVAGKGYP